MTRLPSLKITVRTWKWMVGIFWAIYLSPFWKLFLKMDGLSSFLLGWPIFKGYVRERTSRCHFPGGWRPFGPGSFLVTCLRNVSEKGLPRAMFLGGFFFQKWKLKVLGCKSTRWWFSQTFLELSPLFGEDEPILTSIFFRWVGSTTNQFRCVFFNGISLISRKQVGETMEKPECHQQCEVLGCTSKMVINEGHPGRWTAGTYSHHPFWKENDLNLSPPWGHGTQPLIFRGVLQILHHLCMKEKKFLPCSRVLLEVS